MADQDQDDEKSTAGGPAGIRGYEYQVDVLVWAALELVLSRRTAAQVVLEPCSKEDLEAEIGENDPGKVSAQLETGGRTLVVQAKTRSTTDWALPDVLKLLEHGSAGRPSPKDRLKDPKLRYLVFTDASLLNVAKGLRTRAIDVWPKVADFPASLAEKLPPGSAGRVAFFDATDESVMQMRIHALLTEAFGVPVTQREACRLALRNEARARMAGAKAGVWTRAELEELICGFEGYFASSPMLSGYVPPTNWDAISGQLMADKAVVISGASGTGKTMTSEALWDFASKQYPGLKRVHIQVGPSTIRTTLPNVPVFFDVEDPWGRFKPLPGSEEWNDKLPDFLRGARSDRLFVVTTRSEFLEAAAAKLVKPWIVKLEAENYGPAERAQIYEGRVRELPPRLREYARSNQSFVLGQLSTPLELRKFFDALLASDGPTGTHSRIREAIASAHTEAIHTYVASMIEEREAVRPAAVIWALLKAVEKLSRELIPEVEDHLYAVNKEYGTEVDRLVNVMVAARNLRQVGSVVTYYHSKVAQGFEAALLNNRNLAKEVISNVATVLLALDDSKTDDWGREACANVVAAGKQLTDLRFKCPSDVQVELDKWISRVLLKPDVDFEHFLKLATTVGSAQSAPSELARFLLNTTKGHMGFRSWTPLKEDDEWFKRIAAAPETKAICERFVRTCLPSDIGGNYWPTFSDYLQRLAGDSAIAEAIEPSDEHGHLTKLRFGIVNGFAVEKSIRWLLANSDDVACAVEAFQAAVDSNLVDVVASGFAHKFAGVHALALKASVAAANGQIDRHLYAAADDERGYVREAIAQVMSDRPQPEHFATLLKLSGDDWSKKGGYNTRRDEFPVARAASSGIRALVPILGDQLQFVLDLSASATDSDVRYNLLEALAIGGGVPGQELLLQTIVSPGSEEFRRAACWALGKNLAGVAAEVVARLRPEHLLETPISVAAILAFVVAEASTPDVVRAGAKLVAAKPGRVALLLLMASDCNDEALRDQIVNFLPEGHVLRAWNSLPEQLFPRSSLDDLGSGECITEVLELVSARFEPLPERKPIFNRPKA